MAKKRERNEVEYLRGLIRSLKSEIRQLKKLLGASNKRASRYEAYVEESVEDALQEQETPKIAILEERCPQCEGALSKSDLGIRVLTSCTQCKYFRAEKRKK